MIRAVLDSNVLVSGIPSRTGYPGEVIDAWMRDDFRLITSEHILAEVVDVWRNRYWSIRFTEARIASALFLLRARGVVTAINVNVSGAAPHRQDDLVLATAISGAADYLVTGDRQLLALGTFRDNRRVTTRQFLGALTL